MIHVDRSNIPEPEWWHGEEFRDFLDRWREFHEGGGSRVLQKRMAPSLSAGELERWKRRAVPDLLAGFHSKCAYSEEPISETSGVVVLHRPEGDAVGVTGDISPEHYWWLVGRWDNWFPASPWIAHRKGTLFPVVGTRTTGEEEAALLLDPGIDRPAWHLRFQEDGSVVARDHPRGVLRHRYAGHSRGETTIQILGLNDRHLRARRKKVTAFVEQSSDVFGDLEELLSHLNRDSDASFAIEPVRQRAARELLVLMAEESPSSIAKNWRAPIALFAEQIAAEIAHGEAPPLPEPTVDEILPLIVASFEREWPELSPVDVVALATGAAREEAAFVSQTSSRLSSAVERTARVELISVRNFKAIETLDLDLSTEPVDLPIPFDPTTWNQSPTIEQTAIQATRWTAFLGENGSGKSCCLEAIALALAADRLDDLVEEAKLDWSKLLRRGASEGSIHLRFTDGTQIRLQFDATGHRFLDEEGGELLAPPKMAAYVRGYGATRLLEGGPVEGVDEHVRLANLFDPRAQVLDAQQWLLDLPEEDFNAIAVTLKGFLTDERFEDPDSTKMPLLVREDGDVTCGGDRLSDLSDGYRAVITLLCDIMAGLGMGFSDLRNATGIVLIDELGSHLHPRWKMEITSRLRRELPNVQFFVSTHEPLCLRGLFGGEVVRVRKHSPKPEPGEPRQPGAVSIEVVERSPSDYRVDQLLTSEFFGLDTTIDPDLDRQFQVYYRLLAMSPEDRARLDPDGSRLSALKADLDRRAKPVLGFTRRDQLVYEAIDRFLSQEPRMSPENRQKAREETLQSIQDLWRARGVAVQARESNG